MQYVPFGDTSDDISSHGTHVAGTVGGRRAINGDTESTGAVDGIARAAKISFVDVGVSGESSQPLKTHRSCAVFFS